MDDAARPIEPLRLEDAWPLFGLRIRTPRLELRLPTDDGLLPLLAVALDGIHPPEEMPFGVAWTDAPRPAFERGFLQHHWQMRAGWSPQRWQLNLVAVVDGAIVGSQSIHAEDFAIHRVVDTGSWLGRRWQGRGLGKEMRHGVLGFAFEGLGARWAESGAFLDNAASNAVSRALGYEENGRGSYAPRGEAREMQKWRLAADVWRLRPHPEVAIEGLEACRDLFGA
jgi:RimJ/RimL family protein N-acetyltransferase